MGSGSQLQIAFFAHATPLCYISNFQPPKLWLPWQNPGPAPDSYSIYYIQKHTKLLSSATKLQQSNIFTGICQSFCSGGCLPQCMLGYTFWEGTPPGQVHPLAGTHPPPGRHTPRQVHPQAGTPPRQVHLWQVHPPPWAGTPPPTMVSAVDSMHPTGMLSCYRPQRSCGKVMFSQVCVILFTGGSASVHAGIPPWSKHHPPPGADTPHRRACWEIRSTRRRYASYWNATLFVIFSCLLLVGWAIHFQNLPTAFGTMARPLYNNHTVQQ